MGARKLKSIAIYARVSSRILEIFPDVNPQDSLISSIEFM